MDTSTSAVLVGVISAVGGIIVALIQRGRKENRTDHADVMRSVDRMTWVVENVDKKLDRHINDHEQGRFGGKAN